MKVVWCGCTVCNAILHTGAGKLAGKRGGIDLGVANMNARPQPHPWKGRPRVSRIAFANTIQGVAGLGRMQRGCGGLYLT